MPQHRATTQRGQPFCCGFSVCSAAPPSRPPSSSAHGCGDFRSYAMRACVCGSWPTASTSKESGLDQGGSDVFTPRVGRILFQPQLAGPCLLLSRHLPPSAVSAWYQYLTIKKDSRRQAPRTCCAAPRVVHTGPRPGGKGLPARGQGKGQGGKQGATWTSDSEIHSASLRIEAEKMLGDAGGVLLAACCCAAARCCSLLVVAAAEDGCAARQSLLLLAAAALSSFTLVPLYIPPPLHSSLLLALPFPDLAGT